jgi:diguanylate cyclase (GGDEF)-like protein/PAS domain S-box-containing protein
MAKRAIAIASGTVALGTLAWTGRFTPLFATNYLPHRFCYLLQPQLIWANVATDTLIALSYAAIFSCLMVVFCQMRRFVAAKPYLWIVASFALFIVACGATHLMEVVTIWLPLYPLAAGVKVLCAAVSVPTAIHLARQIPRFAEHFRAYLETLEKTRLEQEEVSHNFRGQIEAITRSQMLIEFDMQGTILQVNDKYLQAFGYERDQVIGKHHGLFVSQEFKASLEYAEFWRHLQSGVYQSGLFQRVDHQGAAVWLEASYNPVMNSAGSPIKVVKIAANLTERMKAEERATEAESRVVLAADSGRIGIWDWDILTNKIEADTWMYRLYGAGTAVTGEFDYTFWSDHLHPDDRARTEQALIDAVEGTAPYETEFRIIWDDGSIHFIKASGMTLLNERGQVTRVVGTNFDITPRKEAEEALRQSNEKQEMLVHGVKDYAIVLLDTEGRVATWNEGAERIFGYQTDEIVGCHFFKFHKQEGLVLGGSDRELDAAVQSWRLEEEGIRVRKDGTEFWASVVLTALYDKDGKLRGYGKVTRDITARKQAEEAKRLAQDEAESANRAKSYFLANMSHELRTPMNAIIGMTHLALRAQPNQQQLGYLNKISRAAQSLLIIMNDILDFSKIEAGKMELETIAFPLQSIWSNLLEIVEEKAESKKLKLSFNIAPNTPPFLLGDPLRLGQILLNLVNNAVKFTEKGEVSVSVSSTEVAQNRVRVLFCVKDTGIGMTPEQLSKVFQSFNQGDISYTRRFGGTGLGLAISRQLCALMGGEMSAESNLGQGSNFYFTVELEVAVEGMRLPSLELLAHNPNNLILIVDDSEQTRLELEGFLLKADFAVRSVASGEEALVALQRASQQECSFDAVLMDWRLPGIDGIQTVRRLKALLPRHHQPAILILSAFDCEFVVNDGDSNGLELLRKPIQEDVLIERLRSALTEKARLNPALHPQRESLPEALEGSRILLVEDNEINRDLATELLGDFGVIVTVAVSGIEGVQRVKEESFDIVLMDIQMPELDGLAATQQIRADGRFPNLPIIAMTAHAMSGDRERSLNAGMNDHLTKPITPLRLQEMLLRWLPARPAKPTATRKGGSSDGSGENRLLPESLPPFNLKAALERTNNKPKLLLKMLLTFHKQYASAPSTLRTQLADGKQQEALLLAHSLKGLAATLEASELTRAASAVETALRSGENSSLSTLLNELERTLQPAIAAIASLQPPTQAAPITEVVVKMEVIVTEKDSASAFLPHLLVVDDTTLDYEHLVEVLGPGYRFEHATSGASALKSILRIPPDLILLDVMMHGISGYDLCKTLKSMPATRDIPIIFLAGANDSEAETRGIELGAVDYITKPLNPTVVRARLKNQIALQRRQAALLALATTDALTGLANRRRFNEALTYECARHARSGRELGLILLDVDFFKQFNDNYGHVAGDECLQSVAAALRSIAPRTTDLIARYGGEEFVILLPETDLSGTLIMAERVREGISQLAIAHGFSVAAPNVTVSVGALSAFCFPGLENSELLTKVDRQLYAAKSGGRNRVCATNFDNPNQLIGMDARKHSIFLPTLVTQSN